jgi:hypothetical protein
MFRKMPKTLFQDDLFRSENADKPWMKSDTDRMLDLYFNGADPDRIAYLLKRNPKAVARRLEQFTYNEDERAERYDMFKRDSRRGKRLTENEKVFIAAHVERKVPMEATARVLCRRVEEIRGESITSSRNKVEDSKGNAKLEHNWLKQVAPTLDMLIAHHYLFWQAKQPVISNKEYDDLRAEEIEYGCGKAAVEAVSKFRQVLDYPPYIRYLAFYIQFRYQVASGKWELPKLPYELHKWIEKEINDADPGS